MMMIAITQAKIGRSMKIRDIGASRLAGLGRRLLQPCRRSIRCGALAGTGLIGCAGLQVADALGDDLVAGLEARR